MTTTMWEVYADLRKRQQRLIDAFRDGDRELAGKLRPGVEKRHGEVKAMFLSTNVGAMGRVAG